MSALKERFMYYQVSINKHISIAFVLLLISRLAISGECENLHLDKTEWIPNQSFNASLPTFGEVCFAAKAVDNSEYGESDYIAFQLYKNGKHLYTLPYPERFLWVAGCSIQAVGFPKSSKDDSKAIVVLGACPTAQDVLQQPIIWLPAKDGFQVSNDLSLKNTGKTNIIQVYKAIKPHIHY